MVWCRRVTSNYLSHCRLFGVKPLPEPVEGPVIWNVMTAILRHCNNNATKRDFGITNDYISNERVRRFALLLARICYWTKVSLVQVMACRLFSAKPLPEPVEGPVIWNVMTANDAVITVMTTRVLFIQIAKCAERMARTMEHAGSEYVFCFKCSHCCVYFSVLELLQPVTTGNPLSRPHWPASGACGLPQPGDQMTLVWPSFSSTQICNFLDSFKWSTAHLDTSLLDWSDM